MQASKLNLLLFVVVLLLITLVWYEQASETTVEQYGLLPMVAGDVSEIAIHNGAERVIKLKRDSVNQWRMVEPLQVAANHHKIETVLDILAQQPTNRFKADKAQLNNYGLQNPQVRLEMSGENGTELLRFGAQTPLNNYRYLQLGDEIVIIDDKAFYPVASIYTNFIASRLLPEGVELASIQLPNFQVQLNEGRWSLQFSNADSGSYSADQLAQWIDGWRYARSVDIEFWVSIV